MSRVGRKPISIPDKMKISYSNKIVQIKGAKGTLTRTIHPDVDLKIKDGVINVSISKEDRKTRGLQGLTRSLVANMIIGVNKEFERKLEINGIGYRAVVEGKKIVLHIGFSHPVDFSLPEGISVSIDKNSLSLTGIDKELVGQTAARIRQLKPPEPYKGKGIKYAEERIQKKAGKTGTKQE